MPPHLPSVWWRSASGCSNRRLGARREERPTSIGLILSGTLLLVAHARHSPHLTFRQQHPNIWTRTDPPYLSRREIDGCAERVCAVGDGNSRALAFGPCAPLYAASSARVRAAASVGLAPLQLPPGRPSEPLRLGDPGSPLGRLWASRQAAVEFAAAVRERLALAGSASTRASTFCLLGIARRVAAAEKRRQWPPLVAGADGIGVRGGTSGACLQVSTARPTTRPLAAGPITPCAVLEQEVHHLLVADPSRDLERRAVGLLECASQY